MAFSHLVHMHRIVHGCVGFNCAGQAVVFVKTLVLHLVALVKGDVLVA